MKTAIYTLLASSIFILPASAIEPLKGSLTFDEPVQQNVQRAPVGSVTFNEIYHGTRRYHEVYRVAPDGDLELMSRRLLSD